MERLKYQFEGICIQSDAYDSDGAYDGKSAILNFLRIRSL